jgi:hypothetical protein
MKCDVIAQGVINAAKQLNLTIPVIVRLQVTAPLFFNSPFSNTLRVSNFTRVYVRAPTWSKPTSFSLVSALLTICCCLQYCFMSSA